MGPIVTKKLPDRSSYKGPSNKEIFAGFKAMQDQIEEDDYFSGNPMTPAEAAQDNQNAAMRADPESRRKSANIARGFREGSRVSPGYEPTKLKITPIIRTKKKDAPAARMPKPQRAVAKINTRKAYDS